ncbi:T9SS type A sorting domain-containing protein [uncultured Duncaniella sp.]|uniref:T9SS type A sorting domain-containing protein n=1 Tax=uncultured Duncaniella sp. TaxID=2768039 RepID=UPI00263904CE|nr:T9SS type A sorting domain-containing protein [uncultured Duncaniella sp.]
MKRLLLPIITACVCVAPAFADEVYGTSPETAKPFPTGGWFLPTLDGAPSEAWFTITSPKANPAQWGDCPGTDKLIWIYLCDGGQEAMQPMGAEGSNTYALLPNQEYLIKITPKVAGFYGMSPFMEFPAKWEGLYKYYPKTVDYNGAMHTLAPGETRWFLYNFDYPSQVTTNYMMMPVMDIEKVEAIHNECPGGTNIGNGMMGPYVKAGQNIIGVTVSSAATADAVFTVGLNGMVTLSCNNNLLRGQSLVLDAANTYPDAYYTVDRFFTVPEDGTYTFINHGAKGTILNVGMVKLTDPANEYAYECDWSNIQSATVGNEDATVVVSGLKAGEKVLVQSDAFGVIGEAPSNLPYLKVVKGDQSGIADVTADGNTLKVNAANGKLNVESVLLASGAEVAVYDMMARKVASATAANGASNLEMNLDVTPGVYIVVVYGKGNSESAKIAVK